jgi:hypothetical protein
MNNHTSLLEPTTLGRTGLKVGRLGVSASYGIPATAVEMAFERGMIGPSSLAHTEHALAALADSSVGSTSERGRAWKAGNRPKSCYR